MLNCAIINLSLSVLSFATIGCRKGGQMSAAMELIERANREKKGIVIIVSGARNMGTRIPICVRFKTNRQDGIVQETSHHDEELTLELDLRHGTNKTAYVCDKNHTKVRVSEFLITDSVRQDSPSYAFISAHVFTSLDELDYQHTDKIPLIPEVENSHHMSEW